MNTQKVTILTTLALLVSLALIQCGGPDERRDATSNRENGWIFEGWACAPNTARALKGESPADYCDTSNIKKNTYLYMKFAARASERAIARESVAMMQSTCRRAAKDQISGDAIGKILGEYLEGASGVEDGESTGQTIVSQFRGKIRGIGVYDCCPLDQDTGLCADPDKSGVGRMWKECVCVGYMRFPGGQAAFNAAAEEAEAN